MVESPKAFHHRSFPKTQKIAMKFGMLVIGLVENHKPIDELAQTIFFGGDILMPRGTAL